MNLSSALILRPSADAIAHDLDEALSCIEPDILKSKEGLHCARLFLRGYRPWLNDVLSELDGVELRQVWDKVLALREDRAARLKAEKWAKVWIPLRNWLLALAVLGLFFGAVALAQLVQVWVFGEVVSR